MSHLYGETSITIERCERVYVTTQGSVSPAFYQLKAIPTVGPSGTFTSYIGALRLFRYGHEMLQEGYEKYSGLLFKIPTLKSWIVIVSSRHLIEEIRRAPDDVLSMDEAFREASSNLTVGPELYEDQFFIEAVKGPLTKNVSAKLADVQDEIAMAFNEYIPIKGDEWVEITAFTAMLDILFIQIVAPLLRSKGLRHGVKLLGPLITERLEQDAKHGADRPNDIITWVLDLTKDRQRSIRVLVNALLIVIFASLHTTSMSFTNVLFELATRPEYVQPLRDEIEAVIQEEGGWSKDSVRKLCKMDSFIKECLRVSNLGLLTMIRKTMKDFTFADGTTIPAGSTLGVPFNAVHTDPDIYADPETFDGFRFEKLREQDGENNKYQVVSLSADYVLFGYGRHACPGRFFATNQLKVMLAHILLNYDVKMPDGKGRPRNWVFGTHIAPDFRAKVLFRKRRDA
ncbi:Cytochrome P450 [Amanita muscaria]